MEYTAVKVCLKLENWKIRHKIHNDTNRSSNPTQKTRPRYSQQVGKTYQLTDFVILADLSKNKGKQKLDKYLELAKELNMNVSVIPIIVGALGTILKNLEKRLLELKIQGRIETVQTTALLWSFIILLIVLENWGNLLSLRLLWRYGVQEGLVSYLLLKVVDVDELLSSVWMIMSFVSDSFILLLTQFTCRLLLSVEGCKRSKEGKRWGYILIQTLFHGFNDNPMVINFTLNQ